MYPCKGPSVRPKEVAQLLLQLSSPISRRTLPPTFFFPLSLFFFFEAFHILFSSPVLFYCSSFLLTPSFPRERHCHLCVDMYLYVVLLFFFFLTSLYRARMYSELAFLLSFFFPPLHCCICSTSVRGCVVVMSVFVFFFFSVCFLGLHPISLYLMSTM